MLMEFHDYLFAVVSIAFGIALLSEHNRKIRCFCLVYTELEEG
jgi:hypothetical protein